MIFFWYPWIQLLWIFALAIVFAPALELAESDFQHVFLTLCTSRIFCCFACCQPGQRRRRRRGGEGGGRRGGGAGGHEGLRCRPAKPMGSPHVGSNPTGVVFRTWRETDRRAASTFHKHSREDLILYWLHLQRCGCLSRSRHNHTHNAHMIFRSLLATSKSLIDMWL